MAQRVLIIEDDQRLAQMVEVYLAQNDFEVVCSGTASAGVDRLLSAAPDDAFAIVLLDLMLPDGNGLDVCRQIREHAHEASAVPIVMLTAKGDTMDRVVGLELGADDYIAKPFEPRELLARMRAVLRRPRTAGAPVSGLLRFGHLEMDRDARTIRLRGQEILITAYQFNLLVAMAERPGRVLSRQLLLDVLKGETLELYDRSIDVHVGRLRTAIEDDPKQPKRILTVRGAGYVFARSQDASSSNE